MPKNGSADDVAALVSYFVSKEAHFVTGAYLVLYVDLEKLRSFPTFYRSNCKFTTATNSSRLGESILISLRLGPSRWWALNTVPLEVRIKSGTPSK